MEFLEQYARAVSEITAATGQPLLLTTENAKVLLWGEPDSTFTIQVTAADQVEVSVSYTIVPAEYLATLAIVDRVRGAMLRHGIPCEVERR